jgi:rubredoxin
MAAEGKEYDESKIPNEDGGRDRMVKITRHTCALCEWTWRPLDPAKKPKICPKCKRDNWDKLDQGTRVMEFSNETMLMAAIFGPWPPESNERYYDEINGVSLHDALIDAVNSVEGQDETKVRAVIIERFGLIDRRTKTQKEVGQILNVSRSRIRQIEVSAMRRLRHPARSSKLRPYIR